MKRTVIVKYFVLLFLLVGAIANFNLVYLTSKLFQLKLLVEISPDYFFSDVIKLIETRAIKSWTFLEMIKIGTKIGYLINPILLLIAFILLYIKKVFNKSSIFVLSLLLFLPFLTEIWLIGFYFFYTYQIKKNVIKKDPPKKEPQKEIPKAPHIDTNIDTRTDEQILNVAFPITRDGLKLSYRTQSTRFHPDKWNDRPEFIKKMMEEEQKKINLAYQRLSKRFKT